LGAINRIKHDAHRAGQYASSPAGAWHNTCCGRYAGGGPSETDFPCGRPNSTLDDPIDPIDSIGSAGDGASGRRHPGKRAFGDTRAWDHTGRRR